MEKSLTSACTPRGRVWVSHGLLLLSPISVYQPSIEVANKLCWTRVALRLLLVSAINSDGADPRSLTRVYTVVKTCGPAAILSYSLSPRAPRRTIPNLLIRSGPGDVVVVR